MKQYFFKAPNPTSFEFEIKELSEISQVSRRIMGAPHRADFYHIIRVETGKSVQTVDFCPIELTNGQILFIAKNQVISFDVSTSYSGQIILFTDIFFNRCECYARLMKQLNLFNPFTGNTPITTSEKLTSILNMMIEEFHQQQYSLQSNAIHSLLNAFFIQASRQIAENITQSQNNNYQIAFQFAELVEQNYKSLRKVNDYIKLMVASAKPLSKSLQAIIGKTPKQFIDSRIVLEAKRMLVYGNESVKEIAFSLGFDEPTNFGKFFREQTGISPAEFKKQLTAEIYHSLT